MTINLIDIKKWTVRLLLIFPLLASIYCVQKILRSSQDSLSKISQVIWFSLAILISETAFEFPQLFVNLVEEQGSRGPGLYLLLQICHILAYIMVAGYHLFSYTFLLNYCPHHILFANIPIIFLILTVLTYVRHADFVHIINRTHELFTGLVMIYICAIARNYFGCFAGIVILFGFFSVRKPTWSVQLDQIYWFLMGVYCNIVILSLTIYEMIEKPVILNNLSLFSPPTNQTNEDDLTMARHVAMVIDEYYARERTKT